MLTTQCTPWFNIVLPLISLQNDILNSIVYGVYKLKPMGSFPYMYIYSYKSDKLNPNILKNNNIKFYIYKNFKVGKWGLFKTQGRPPHTPTNGWWRVLDLKMGTENGKDIFVKHPSNYTHVAYVSNVYILK